MKLQQREVSIRVNITLCLVCGSTAVCHAHLMKMFSHHCKIEYELLIKCNNISYQLLTTRLCFNLPENSVVPIRIFLQHELSCEGEAVGAVAVS